MKKALMVAMAFAFCLSAFSMATLQPEVEASAPVITLYPDNRSGWESAVGVYDEECFTDAILNSGVSVVSEYPGYVDTAKGVWWDRLVCPAYGMTTTTWQFSTPIVGFGGNWNPGVPGGPGAHIAVAIDGSWVSVGEIPNTYTGQFWGLVSSEPFQTVCLSPGSYCNGAWCETYELDNMVYAFLGIRIIQPNGGDSWAVGSTQSITWISSGVIGNVNVSLSRDGGSSWENIASGVANDGNLIWRITGPITNQALIKITSASDPSIYDFSDSSFSITTRPTQVSPTIIAFTPKSGYAGTEVSIVGTNFIKDDTIVIFGTIPADQDDIVWRSRTLIVARVPNAPETATTGKITIKTSEGTAISTDNFIVMSPSKPWGTQIGVYNSVPAYSNGGWYSVHYDDQGNPTRSPYGLAYQCVEYVNRYYVLALEHQNMTGTGNADSYYYNAQIPGKGLVAFANGGKNPPEVNDILVFDKDGLGSKPGHVAIITDLETDKDGKIVAISIIQQNAIWKEGGAYRATASLNVKVKRKDGEVTYEVSNVGSGTKSPVVGWSRIPE